MLQRDADPQVDFQPIIVHPDPVGELAEHNRIGGVHLFSAVNMLLEGIHPVFYFCESSYRCFEFPLTLLQLVHLLAVEGDFDFVVPLTYRTLLLSFVEGEDGFLYGYDILLHLFQFCVVIDHQNLCTVFLHAIQCILRSVECCSDSSLRYIFIDVVAVAHRSSVADPAGATPT